MLLHKVKKQYFSKLQQFLIFDDKNFCKTVKISIFGQNFTKVINLTENVETLSEVFIVSPLCIREKTDLFVYNSYVNNSSNLVLRVTEKYKIHPTVRSISRIIKLDALVLHFTSCLWIKPLRKSIILNHEKTSQVFDKVVSHKRKHGIITTGLASLFLSLKFILYIYGLLLMSLMIKICVELLEAIFTY